MSDFRYSRNQTYRPEYSRDNREDNRHRRRRSRSRSHSIDRHRANGVINRQENWREDFPQRGRPEDIGARSWGNKFYYDDREENSKRRKTRHERERMPEGRWRERNLGEPNNHVILQGLPLAATENDIQHTLDNLHASIENIRLIRDRRTGDSRRFAFVKFTSVEHARQFIEANHPFIMMEDIRVRVEYSNSASAEDEGWACKNCGFLNYKKRESCHQCHHSKKGVIRLWENTTEPFWASSQSMVSGSLHLAPTNSFFNDGANDLAQVPHHILLVRGLDPLTTEETLYASASQVAALRRVLLIKDRASRMSWGFAFLDYHDVQTSSYALSIFNNPHYYPGGFVVDSRTVSMTFAHPGSFTPAYATTEWTIWGDDGIAMSYWDQKAYAVEYCGSQCSVPIESNMPSSSTNSTSVNEAENKSRKESSEATKEVIAVPETKLNVEDELNAFYSDMGAVLTSTGKAETKSIFSVSDMVSTSNNQNKSNFSPKKNQDPELNAFYADLETVEQQINPTQSKGKTVSAKSISEVDSQGVETQQISDDKIMNKLPSADNDFTHQRPSGIHSPREPINHEQQVPSQQINQFNSSTSRDSLSPETLVSFVVNAIVPPCFLSLHHVSFTIPPIDHTALVISYYLLVIIIGSLSGHEPETVEENEALREVSISTSHDLSKGVKEKKKKSNKPIGKKVHEQLQKWNERKEELHQINDTNQPELSDDGLFDYTLNACLLCHRQFIDLAELQKHEQLSDLHKLNMENEHLVQTIRMKRAYGLQNDGDCEKPQTRYNNRAAQRRKIYGQPRRPAPPAAPGSSNPVEETYEQPTKFGIGEDNIGNRLLQNMGWKAGEGLGKNKNGIVVPIQPEIYTAGVGLGASNSHSILEDGQNTYYGMAKKFARARLEES
ncbi:6040_t:CDS:10 [Funneliformis mosseae]|uniref:6040_t:CDS:1 n=1 Tax=Funneliformis mosseae TaxID=27381 RepID=A0A9N9GGB6_FUNMO|nr:6040_t:CDS:10 [Funneliformis mosseae]